MNRLLLLLVMVRLTACCQCPPPPKAATAGGFPEGAKNPASYGLTKETLQVEGVNWTVYVTGPTSGRPVLLLHELPGLTPGCARLAADLAAASPACRVYVPLLFGKFGDSRGGWPTFELASTRRWNPFSSDDPGTILPELIGLCEHLSVERAGGRPLAVVGNCLTGSLALGALVSDHVACAVVSQPAVPLAAWTKGRKGSLWLPPEVLAELSAEGGAAAKKPVLYFRYAVDSFSPPERLVAAAVLLGCRLEAKVLAEEQPAELPCGVQWVSVDEEASGRDAASGEEVRLHSVITRYWGIQPMEAQQSVWLSLIEFIHRSP